MNPDPKKMADAEVVALAQAERDAGVPDVQTAEAAADVEARQNSDAETEAHPS